MSNKNSAGSLFFQPRFTVSEPGNPDSYRDEKEADAVADKIMRMAAPSSQKLFFQPSPVQRKCDHCEEEEKKLKRKENDEITKASGDTTIQRSGGGSYIPENPPASALPATTLPHFEAGSGNIDKRNIKDTLRDEGTSFSFGWVNPPLFKWENEVIAHAPEGMFGNWVVGVLQLMKDYCLSLLLLWIVPLTWY